MQEHLYLARVGGSDVLYLAPSWLVLSPRWKPCAWRECAGPLHSARVSVLRLLCCTWHCDNSVLLDGAGLSPASPQPTEFSSSFSWSLYRSRGSSELGGGEETGALCLGDTDGRGMSCGSSPLGLTCLAVKDAACCGRPRTEEGLRHCTPPCPTPSQRCEAPSQPGGQTTQQKGWGGLSGPPESMLRTRHSTGR